MSDAPFVELLQGCYGIGMARHGYPPSETDQSRDDMLRRALATPPISNEDIVKRSKESRRK